MAQHTFFISTSSLLTWVEADILGHSIRNRLYGSNISSSTSLVELAQVSKLLLLREVMRGESSCRRRCNVMIIWSVREAVRGHMLFARVMVHVSRGVMRVRVRVARGCRSRSG